MTSNLNSTKTFTLYRDAMIALQQQIVNANKSEQPGDEAVWIKQTHFLAEYKLSKNFFKALESTGLVTIEVNPQKRIGSYIRWVKPGKDNAIVLTEDVNSVLAAITDINKVSTDRAKSNAITNTQNIVGKVNFDPKKIDHQIQILKSKLEKEQAAKGYLRADEAMIYPHVISGLETLKAIKELA